MKTTNRYRWKAVAALAVLVVGAVGLCLWASKPPARKEFVSRADPFAGYRCRFTVSKGWQCKFKHETGLTYDREEWTFTLPRNPIRKWIESHLLYKASSVEHTITITCGNSGGMRAVHTEKGIEYTEPVGVYSPTQIESERYFMIDHCAVTLATTKLGSAHAAILEATAPEYGLELWLDSSAEEASFPQTRREVQAIIASLHFEKIAGGKQGSGRP